MTAAALAAPGWRAELKLELASRPAPGSTGQRDTYLARAGNRGPLRLQRPCFAEGGAPPES